MGRRFCIHFAPTEPSSPLKGKKRKITRRIVIAPTVANHDTTHHHRPASSMNDGTGTPSPVAAHHGHCSRWRAAKIAGPRTPPIRSSRPGVTVIWSLTAGTFGRSTGRRWLTPSTPFMATSKRPAGRTFSARTVSIL